MKQEGALVALLVVVKCVVVVIQTVWGRAILYFFFLCLFFFFAKYFFCLLEHGLTFCLSVSTKRLASGFDTVVDKVCVPCLLYGCAKL